MHILQPKCSKLSQNEVDKLLTELNISLTQLPKIRIIDTSLPEGCEVGEVIKIERVTDNKKAFYYRVITV
ncbi:DNA-directed RNA polymerase subunit H [Candidatus Pacearchaeota archaeon]|nr:DNA-directed RNA polymerase subunit H [Candidatus Pacearchaeota archaeon]